MKGSATYTRILICKCDIFLRGWQIFNYIFLETGTLAEIFKTPS
jgi:hypothetical protein